ncbi:hypothetical protein [Archangium lansingense]|uniref:Lipoprotein n=1 Tax=Archangium lansingense TaxID=2995310 RepID=A0ABT4AI46_9BACT|nr:hypothetical protein [Archangium lansinium]MCY1080884.1 hypothetical protein [Archangium lansinium]
MTRAIRSRILAAILPALCACATPASTQRAPKDAVTLRFAWPEHLAARVSYSVTMNSPLGNTQVQRRYWLTVAPTEEQGHYQFVPSDIEVSPPQFAAMVDPVPTVHFDDEGCFQGIDISENLPGQQMLEVLPMEPEKKAELLENLVAAQEESALEYWDRLVGNWRGVTLVPGEPVRRESTMVVGTGFMEKKEVAADEHTSIEVGVPCTPDAQERRCVRLTVDLQPVGQSEAGTGPMASKRFELVTDPDTLVPYSTRLMRMDRVDWGEDGGAQPLKEFLQVEEYVYTYGAQRMPPGSNPL